MQCKGRLHLRVGMHTYIVRPSTLLDLITIGHFTTPISIVHYYLKGETISIIELDINFRSRVTSQDPVLTISHREVGGMQK